MISKEEMIPMLLAACPGLRAPFEAAMAEWDGPSPGLHLEIMEFVALLLEAYERGDSECVQAAFDTAEKFLAEGDSGTREYAKIGFIEDIQNAASWRSCGAGAFLRFLKPHSKKAWDDLEEFWSGGQNRPQ